MNTDPERGHSRPSAHHVMSGSTIAGSVNPHQFMDHDAAIKEVPQDDGNWPDPKSDSNNLTSKIWDMYLSREYKKTKERSKHWLASADGVIVFSGLFSVVLVTFLLISYPLLLPNPSDTTNELLAINNQLLSQLSQQSPSNGTGSSQPSLPNDSSFHPPNYAVSVNGLFLSSLFLSVGCAMWATILQQWVQNLLQAADTPESPLKPGGIPSERALIYASYQQGMDRLHFNMEDAAIGLLPSLLHASVAIFCIAVLQLLFNVNHTIAYIWLTWFSTGCLIYTAATSLPLIYPKSPYYTPLSFPFRSLNDAISRWLCKHPVRAVIRKDMINALQSKVIEPIKESTGKLRAEAEINVITSLIDSLDEDQEYEDFLDGLPGLFQDLDSTSYLTALREPLQELVKPATDYLLTTCTATSLLPEALRSQRLTASLEAVWCFYGTIDRHLGAICEQWDKVTDDHWGTLSIETWTKASSMTTNPDPFIAVRAHCIEALMAVMWKKGRWQCASPKGLVKATELLKRQLHVPSLDVTWLTDKDHLQLAVAANLLSKSLLFFDGQGTSADTSLKTQLKQILDSICRELDVSDVRSELKDRFVDAAEVMKVFNIQDVDSSFGHAAFGPCAKIVK